MQLSLDVCVCVCAREREGKRDYRLHCTLIYVYTSNLNITEATKN